jgi:hypothetical protein
MFTELAIRLTASATLLHELFKSPGELNAKVAKIKGLEHEADNLTHDIIDRIDRTFVTPFDREDIHALISRLDDILDLIEEVADTCILYNIDAPTPAAMEQAEIIVRQCEQLAEGLTKLRHFKGVEPFWIEVHRLENDGDRVARQAVAELFKHGQDPMDVIKWKDVYALLEKAIDSAEDAANVIERIVVKHA